MSSIKVLHVINSLTTGGAENHLLTLCRFLKDAGVDVEVAFLKERIPEARPMRADFEGAGIPVTHLGGELLFAPGAVAAFLKLVRTTQPSIVHTHLPRADFLGAIGTISHPSIPWVCSLHDISGPHWSGYRFLPVLTRCWKRADLLIAISDAVRQWANAQHALANCDIRVITYGIDVEGFAAGRRAAVPQRFGREPFVVCSIGRLEPRKGHQILIEAMPAILSRVPSARLEIVGHDPWGYGEVLCGLIRRLQLEERATLAGFMTDVSPALARAHVFAFASQKEGFGQVLIEAMACARPVVASNIAPINEIVVDGVTGWLVEPGSAAAFADRICWLAANPAEAERMGREGLARVRTHFSASRMGSETVAAYKEVLRRGRV